MGRAVCPPSQLLAWGIPVMVPADSWMGPGISADNQHGSHQECSWGCVFPSMSDTCVYDPKVSCSHSLPPWEAFQDQEAPIKLLLLCESLCSPLRVKSLSSPVPWGSSWPSKPNSLGACSLHWTFQAGEPDTGLRILILMGEPLQRNHFSVCGSTVRDMGLDFILSSPLPPVSLWFLLYVFIVDLFSRFQSFSSMVVLQIVMILMCL